MFGGIARELFPDLLEKQRWTEEAKSVVEATVDSLLSEDTDANAPGMLLGKIQSGKTRAFLGVIALAFDRGYDIAIVLTKGTRALARQTLRRIESDFAEAIAEHRLSAFDIMSVPADLSPGELRSKLILVVKKEDDNLHRTERFLFDEYPELGNRRVIIVDDEADFASVGVRGNAREGFHPAVLVELIQILRQRINRVSFLQVTATPYSLYLQPDADVLAEHGIYQPIRPAFTHVVPTHSGYLGGDVYFEDSQVDGSVASYLFVPVSETELSALKGPDARRLRLDDVLTSQRCEALRSAIVGFVMAGAMARMRDHMVGDKLRSYSFVIHTESARRAHEWQANIAREIIRQLRALDTHRSLALELYRSSYDSFAMSLEAANLNVPEFDQVVASTKEGLDALTVQVVNSEVQIETLLDATGQLRLRTPLNIFIGGQILDRGLTIENMIGFYYGRNPQRFQQDTVLQHCRMFGARREADLPLTRFYTSDRIHRVMEAIHSMDAALRSQIEAGGPEKSAVFIQRVNQQVTPCNPNRLRLSRISTIRPGRKLIPVWFNTKRGHVLNANTETVDTMIENATGGLIDRSVSEVSVDEATHIIKQSMSALEWAKDDPYVFDTNAMISALEYLAGRSRIVRMYLRIGSNAARLRADGRFSNSPETGPQENVLNNARSAQVDCPLLVMMKNTGEAPGWHGSAFWWPILYAQVRAMPVIYCADTIEDDGN